jgi:phosphodiesterase/alkaline phosphatase D-like protein
MSHRHVIAGPLSGSVAESEAVIKAVVEPDITNVSLVLKANEKPGEGDAWRAPDNIWADPEREYENNIYTFRVSGLLPDTKYHFALVTDGKIEENARGKLRTFPKAGEPAGFKFAFGSCSKDPEAEVFSALKEEKDLSFFFHLGDFHYGNPKAKSVAKRLKDFDKALNKTAMGKMLRELPLAYTWDDHDFIDNDTGGEANPESRKLALAAYETYIPHYPLVNRERGIFQSFVVGRVLFILTDTRFNQSTRDREPVEERFVFGDEQLGWIGEKLEQGREMDLIVVTSSFPYVSRNPDKPGDWFYYPADHRRFANLVKEKNIRNLCMISGDAHMLAIDDGSHSGFAENDKGGFPVFHAASLFSSVGSKGGPYSKGSQQNNGSFGYGIEGRNQYGLFEITYHNEEGFALETPEVLWKGRRVENGVTRDLISHRFNARETFADF